MFFKLNLKISSIGLVLEYLNAPGPVRQKTDRSVILTDRYVRVCFNCLISEISYYRPHMKEFSTMLSRSSKNKSLRLEMTKSQVLLFLPSTCSSMLSSILEQVETLITASANVVHSWQSSHLDWWKFRRGWPSPFYHAWAPDYCIKVQALLPGHRSLGLLWEVLEVWDQFDS